MGQNGLVAGSQPPAGVPIELSHVVGRGGVAAANATSSGGVTLSVPAGQSVALLSQPREVATGLLDAVGGLSRPLSGQVSVDGVSVGRLGGADLDRYRAGRGLVSARFPLLPSLSVTGNVLALPLAGRVDERARERAARLLELTGAARLTDPVTRLADEDQWRIMIARALLPSPRLMLAEDPMSVLDPRAAGRILDVLTDAHATFGFTLVLAADRLASAVRCQRQVSLVNGIVVEDETTSGDDAWTRSRIDRIG